MGHTYSPGGFKTADEEDCSPLDATLQGWTTLSTAGGNFADSSDWNAVHKRHDGSF